MKRDFEFYGLDFIKIFLIICSIGSGLILLLNFVFNISIPVLSTELGMFLILGMFILSILFSIGFKRRWKLSYYLAIVYFGCLSIFTLVDLIKLLISSFKISMVLTSLCGILFYSICGYYLIIRRGNFIDKLKVMNSKEKTKEVIFLILMILSLVTYFGLSIYFK